MVIAFDSDPRDAFATRSDIDRINEAYKCYLNPVFTNPLNGTHGFRHVHIHREGDYKKNNKNV